MERTLVFNGYRCPKSRFKTDDLTACILGSQIRERKSHRTGLKYTLCLKTEMLNPEIQNDTNEFEVKTDHESSLNG
jgi:hypothetical protein